MTLPEFLRGHLLPDWDDDPALYAALLPIARGWAMARGVQFADADALAAQVLQKFEPGPLPPSTNGERVLRRRLRNAVYDFLTERRARRLRDGKVLGEVARLQVPEREGELTSAQMQGLVMRALARLTHAERSLIEFDLTVRNDRERYKRIVARFGYSDVRSARQMVHKALEALRREVSRLKKELR